MKRVGILSDTHGTLPEAYLGFFVDVDEIWHAGDIGSEEVASKLAEFKPLRAVYGNIDAVRIRQLFSEQLVFDCEGVKVFMTHIGGYPGKYNSKAKGTIVREKPGICVCGHSHILKVMFDQRYNLLHINPGAAGASGFHTHITMIRCTIENGKVKDLEVYDKPKRM
ncbi:MAG: metallophosphoesterase family protein [Bacteroidales bacterium]|nr:metallophosphoesterase family protein [Bacteroidales bacterium]